LRIQKEDLISINKTIEDIQNWVAVVHQDISNYLQAVSLDLQQHNQSDYFISELISDTNSAIPSPISMSSFGFGSHPARLAVAWRLRGIQR